MDFESMANRAKKIVADRGGSESVKEDAEELREIAEGEGSWAEKAKRAAAALKEPGAHHEAPSDGAAGAGATKPRAPEAG